MARNFTDTLNDLQGGMIALDLNNQLSELVREVDSTGKAGSLTLKIVVSRTKSIKDAMSVQATVSSKLPKADNNGTLMFPTPEGSLSRKHPRQDDLPGLSLAQKPASTIDPNTGEVIAAA